MILEYGFQRMNLKRIPFYGRLEIVNNLVYFNFLCFKISQILPLKTDGTVPMLAKIYNRSLNRTIGTHGYTLKIE